MDEILESGIPEESFGSMKETEDKSSSLEKTDGIKGQPPNDTSSFKSEVVHSFKIDESREIKQKESNGYSLCCTSFIKECKILFWIEMVLLIFICTAVAVGFTVPIIIYAVDTDLGNSTQQYSSDLNLDDCSNTATQVCIVYSCVISRIVEVQLYH